MSGRIEISAGFLPLLDSALLVVAAVKDLATREGIELTLVRETSWATIRDRLAAGHFQVAHMLAPMPLAGNLGLNPLAARTIVPMALGLGGNAVTVSNGLWAAMQNHGAKPDLDARVNGQALAAVVAARHNGGWPRLRFAVVHPHSAHNYELRYWLAACGVAPDVDVDIEVISPPRMATALAAGEIDGYCVGEPWNTASVMRGSGRIATVKAAIWQSSPDKVLGVAADWAEAQPEALAALMRAVYRAAEWCGQRANHVELAAILAQPEHVGVPAEWLLPALCGRIPLGGDVTVQVDDFFIPFAKASTFPWRSHALWFYSQMVRWGQVGHDVAHTAIAADIYRPDIYRRVLRPLGAPLPGANAKVEGAITMAAPVGASGGHLTLGPDGFFDGSVFDPDQLDAYIASYAAHRS
jgi:NitT/TauT family transport system ATP-binding protein